MASGVVGGRRGRRLPVRRPRASSRAGRTQRSRAPAATSTAALGRSDRMLGAPSPWHAGCGTEGAAAGVALAVGHPPRKRQSAVSCGSPPASCAGRRFYGARISAAKPPGCFSRLRGRRGCTRAVSRSHVVERGRPAIGTDPRDTGAAMNRHPREPAGPDVQRGTGPLPFFQGQT
jgi:hypothetical protein